MAGRPAARGVEAVSWRGLQLHPAHRDAGLGDAGRVCVATWRSRCSARTLKTLNDIAVRMVEALKKVEGAEDVLTIKNDGVQYYRVVIDRLAAGRLGASVDDIAAALRAQVEGQTAGLVLEPGRRTPDPAAWRRRPAHLACGAGRPDADPAGRPECAGRAGGESSSAWKAPSR